MISNSRFEQEKIEYSIYSYSSYTNHYHPSNILKNDPMNSHSRWSSGSRETRQFLVLKLQDYSIPQCIGFGKFHLPHVCNLKEFAVYSSFDGNNWWKVCHKGLKNNNETEYFPLAYYKRQWHKERGSDSEYKEKTVYLPSKYIKIVPLMTWGASFNYGIWYVEIRGILNREHLVRAIDDYKESKERESLRYIANFFLNKDSLKRKVGESRRMAYEEICSVILEKTRILLEDEIITKIYRILFENDQVEYQMLEKVIEEANSKGYFQDQVSNVPYMAVWERIKVQNPWPGQRGGHQMVVDEYSGDLYLFGGWDGTRDLDDLWVFRVQTRIWELLGDGSRDYWPCARSVHKLCYFRKRRWIFMMGKYVENLAGMDRSDLDNDFWIYDIEKATWIHQSRNTAKEGGPESVYDTQMAVDNSRQLLFVFGGKLTKATLSDPSYLGLYVYDIRNASWKCLRIDREPVPNTPHFTSRVGHVMLINEPDTKLYIFGGQRHRELCHDFIEYDYVTDTVTGLVIGGETETRSNDTGMADAGQIKHEIPLPSFSQRATIDTRKCEIVVFGILKNGYEGGIQRNIHIHNRDGDLAESTSPKHRNEIWVCSYHRNHQSPTDELEEDFSNWKWVEQRGLDKSMRVPSMRYAHVFVYDADKMKHYLFGGNAGEICSGRTSEGSTHARLNDLWVLELAKPSTQKLVNKIKFLIRRQIYLEMIYLDPLQGTRSLSSALEYLKTRIKEVVDADDPSEVAEFRCLPQYLFRRSEGPRFNAARSRKFLYHAITNFFPDHLKRPSRCISDMII